MTRPEGELYLLEGRKLRHQADCVIACLERWYAKTGLEKADIVMNPMLTVVADMVKDLLQGGIITVTLDENMKPPLNFVIREQRLHSEVREGAD